jgi:hypothetical protein
MLHVDSAEMHTTLVVENNRKKRQASFSGINHYLLSRGMNRIYSRNYHTFDGIHKLVSTSRD